MNKYRDNISYVCLLAACIILPCSIAYPVIEPFDLLTFLVLSVFGGSLSLYLLFNYLCIQQPLKKTFTIRRGRQYSSGMMPVILDISYPNIFEKTFIFTGSCRDSVADAKNAKDWNKLTGFTLGLSKDAIHQNSVRVAWRYNSQTDLIELIPYAYCKGYRYYDEKKLYATAVNKPIKIRIFSAQTPGIIVRSLYFGVTINNQNFIINDNDSKILFFDDVHKYGWLCFPYFGGDSTSPDTMQIINDERIEN